MVIFPATSAFPEWGEPVNLGPNVNSGLIEYYPCISADGAKLYYTICGRPGGFGDDDIWISAWDGAEWGIPVNAGPNVNWEWRDLSPSISSDGSKLYFVSWGRAGGYGSYDVWVSTWEDTMWGPAVNAGPNVNTPGIEWSVNISFDGQKLYFASDQPGTYGFDDIWVSEWDSMSGEWGPAANLGTNINTFNSEYSPSVSQDGSQLYFARWGGGQGFVDIYVSQWEDSIWGPAANLGPPVNTATWDDGPSISSDGTKLYFASGPDTNYPAVQDIWVSEWLPGIQEERGGAIRRSEGRLLQIHPTPFRFRTSIRLLAPDSSKVSLTIYDTSGRLVRSLLSEHVASGTLVASWDGSDDRGQPCESGVYFCRLTSNASYCSEKVLLVR
jgi:Tol biopolymer transport system component